MCYRLNSFGNAVKSLIFASLNLKVQSTGGVQEWLNWHAWKVCILERVSRVRIPSPPLKGTSHQKDAWPLLYFRWNCLSGGRYRRTQIYLFGSILPFFAIIHNSGSKHQLLYLFFSCCIAGVPCHSEFRGESYCVFYLFLKVRYCKAAFFQLSEYFTPFPMITAEQFLKLVFGHLVQSIVFVLYVFDPFADFCQLLPK